MLLTIIFIGITVVSIIAALVIHFLHKRYKARQREYADSLLEEEKRGIGTRFANDSCSSFGHSSSDPPDSLRAPSVTHFNRPGRRSWTGDRSRGGPFQDRSGASSSASTYKDDAPLKPQQQQLAPQQHPLAKAFRPISTGSLRTLSPPPSEEGRLRDDQREALNRSPFFTITEEGEISEHDVEKFRLDDDDADLVSLSSYYGPESVGKKKYLLPPITITADKHDSAFSLGGLVDMYGDGSPTMGMGSPTSPTGILKSRLSTRGLLSPGGKTQKRVTWKQPAYPFTGAANGSWTSLNSTLRTVVEDEDGQSFQELPMPAQHSPFNAAFPSPARSSSDLGGTSPAYSMMYEDQGGRNVLPTVKAQLEPDTLPSVFTDMPPRPSAPSPRNIKAESEKPFEKYHRMSQSFLTPPPGVVQKASSSTSIAKPAPPPTIIIPSAPARVPTTSPGGTVPVKRKLRGASLAGEIMRIR